MKNIEKSLIDGLKGMIKIKNELKINRMVHCPYICRYVSNFEDDDNVYIMMDPQPNGTLQELLHRRKFLEEIEVQFFGI